MDEKLYKAALGKRISGALEIAWRLEAVSVLTSKMHRRVVVSSRYLPAEDRVLSWMDRWLTPCDEIRDFGLTREQHDALVARQGAIRKTHGWSPVTYWGRKAADHATWVIGLHSEWADRWKEDRHLLADALEDPKWLNVGNNRYRVKLTHVCKQTTLWRRWSHAGRPSDGVATATYDVRVADSQERSDLQAALAKFGPPPVACMKDFDLADLIRPTRIGRIFGSGLREDRERYLLPERVLAPDRFTYREGWSKAFLVEWIARKISISESTFYNMCNDAGIDKRPANGSGANQFYKPAEVETLIEYLETKSNRRERHTVAAALKELLEKQAKAGKPD